jgi:hypothetical protein
MNLLDLVPIVPPSLPGERSSELTSAQRFAAGVASTLLPAINFFIVLLAGFAFSFGVAFVALPLASAAIAYFVARMLAVTVAWAVVLAMGVATFCLIGNGFALAIRGLMQFFHDF